MSGPGDNESGILVYPQLPMPKPRRGEPRMSTHRDRRGRRIPLFAMLIAAIAGGAAVWFGKPFVAPDPQVAMWEHRAAASVAAAEANHTRAESLDKQLAAATTARRDAETKLAAAETAQTALATKAADDAAVRKAAEAVQTKLKAAVAGLGAMAIEGADVHVRIPDRALFKPNDDALTDRGKAALGRLALALKELPDKQIAIQGHTDDAPIALPRPPPPPPRGSKAPPPPAPVIRFPTNWELSGARAVAVVRYFQDIAKLDPSRLTALAFGQYAPASNKDRSLNRRLEIVIAPRHGAK
jgi:chemotaxis protein MotB